MMFWFLLLLFTLPCNNNSEFIGANEKVVVDLLYARHVFENPESVMKFYVNSVKYNRTYIGLNINATFTEPFDSTYQLDFETRVWGDGGWKRNFFHFQKNDACYHLSLYTGFVWFSVLKSLGAPARCPIPPGFYHVENYPLDLSHVPLIMQSGRFFNKIMFLKNKEIVADIEVEVQIAKIFLH